MVVDTAGIPEAGTIRLQATSNDAYGQAVLAAVEHFRFSPALRQGTKVRQLSVFTYHMEQNPVACPR